MRTRILAGSLRAFGLSAPLEAVLLVCFAACSGPSETGLNGSFEGKLPGQVPVYQYLGISIVENNGNVSGSAFYSYTPGYAGTVTGTLEGEEFDLFIRDVYYGGTDVREFRGRIEGNTLSGELSLHGYDGTPFQAARTNTTATGRSSTIYEGELTETVEGPTEFGLIGTLAVSLSVGRFPTGLQVNWSSSERPREGRYEFGGTSPGGVVRIPREGGGTRDFPIQSGWIEIDLSERYVLAGQFDVWGRETGSSASLRARGSFNAGCSIPSC